MKIGKYNFTLKNIKSFIQGKTRMLVERFGNEFFSLDEHIKEQIVWRETKSNNECINNKECKCGCPLPDMFFADKACEDECYPVMMTKEEWETYKTNNLLNDAPAI
jgi:hypothetical protein